MGERKGDMTTKKKKLGIVAIAAAVVLGLTGCKVNVHYTLHQDDTVSGEVIMAMGKQVAEGLGLAREDLAGRMGDSDVVGGIEGVESQPYDDGTDIGNKYTFANQPLESIAANIDGTLVREDDTFVFQGTSERLSELEDSRSNIEGMEGTEGMEFLEGLFDNAEISMSITFPGAVTDTNGSVCGTTATWDLLTLTEAPYATGGAIGTGVACDSSSGDSDEGMPIWVWFAIAGGAVILIGAIVMLSRRSKEEAAPASKAEAPAKATDKKATDKKAPAKKATDKK
jgi:hypothetical protein